MRCLRLAFSVIAVSLTACNDGSPSNQGETPIPNAQSSRESVEGLNASESGGSSAPADNAQGVEAPKAGSPRSPNGYRLVGTEPFWGGMVTGEQVLYSTPENQSGEPV